jgi:hypothetical protein
MSNNNRGSDPKYVNGNDEDVSSSEDNTESDRREPKRRKSTLTTAFARSLNNNATKTMDTQKDKDIHNTRMPRYNREKHNILEWLLQLDNILGGKKPSGRERKDDKSTILLERLSLAASQELVGREETYNKSYEELQMSMCRVFMDKNPHLMYVKHFNSLKHKRSVPIETFLTDMLAKWKQYNFSLHAQNKHRKSDSDFFEYFLKALHRETRKPIKKKINTKRILTFRDLQKYIHDNAEQLDDDDSSSEDEDFGEIQRLRKENTELRKKKQKAENGLTNIRSKYDEVSRNLPTEDESSNLTPALQAIKETQNELLSIIQGYKDKEATNAFNNQKQINNHQIEGRHLYNHRSEHRGRSRSPPSYRYCGEQRDLNYMRGGNFSGNQDRARSRSHSPTPQDSKCFACMENHWIINCPYSTRVERELELFKVFEKIRNSHGNLSTEREKQLRQQHDCVEGKRNRYLTHDQGHQPTGIGHYCKWCHTRGHSTWICPNFCSICEESGHGWESCPKDTTKVAVRKEKFGTLLAKLRMYSAK